MQSRISESMQGMLGAANGNMMEKMMEQGHSITSVRDMFKEYLEKQKNSTLKGKESEIKLEILLNSLYSHGKVCNNTGEAQSGDYLLEREGKASILFENKDYNTNVPDVEIKKFIRDIENKKTHGKNPQHNHNCEWTCKIRVPSSASLQALAKWPLRLSPTWTVQPVRAISCRRQAPRDCTHRVQGTSHGPETVVWHTGSRVCGSQ